MPSFSLLRRSPKDRKPPDHQTSEATLGKVVSTSPDHDPNGGGVLSGEKTSDDRRGSGSKRELFHGLISRGKLLVSPAGGSSSSPPTAGPVASAVTPPRRGKPCAVEPQDQKAAGKTGLPALAPKKSPTSSTSSPPFSPLSSRSNFNPNKPLPSPPPPGSEEAVKPPPKPVLKLARIMSTLSETELEKLFSGAPQYFARSEGPNTGAPNPSVAFPWDESLDIRDLTDHTQIEDEAWGCVTALPHIIRSPRRPSSSGSGTKGKLAHFYPKCRERPNMLSMQGLEKGTVGYSAALELAVADALQEEQFGFEASGYRANAVIEARQRMLTSKDGLRHMEEAAIMEQLIKNGRRYVVNNITDNTLSTDLYNELFLHILHPPTRVLDHSDPYSLSVQIQALLKVLGAPNVWVDFSHVEWRIRLGQILWGAPGDPTAGEDDVDDGASTHTTNTSAEARSEERYWLLLQILLACELWIRLDAIVEAEDAGTGHIKPREIYRFQQEATPSVKWSMLLARSWLENIEITKTEPSKQGGEHGSHQPTGWLATLTKRMSLTSDHQGSSTGGAGNAQGSRPSSSRTADDQPAYTMRGKHGQRQVDGLTHFARRLKWPGIESYENRISSSIRAVAEGTPLNSPPASPLPTSTETHRSSYFGGTAGIFSARNVNHHSNGDDSSTNGGKMTHIADQIRRQPSKRRKISAALHPSGWLSKSYVSGFMLPGEGLNHFIMATLLENDGEAMRRLGPVANLCGGFVYSDKSFWSTACIVGRVVAAGKGAVECMGWISSDVKPEGMGDGWVNIEVAEPPGDAARTGKQARIWGKTIVERQSSVLGDADPDSVFPADFIIPFENIYKEALPPAISIELKSLKLFAPVDSVHTTPTGSGALTPSHGATPATETTSSIREPPEIHTYPAAVTFSVYEDYDDGDVIAEKQLTFCLSNDVYFATAHPCVPSQHVKILKSPSSPTIQQIDLDGGSSSSSSSSSSVSGFAGKPSSSVNITGHPLHKYYTYTAIHLSELLARRDSTLEEILNDPGPNAHRRPSVAPGPQGNKPPRVLVVDCITGFQPLPQAHEIPLSPVVSRTSSINISWPQSQAQASPPSSPPRGESFINGTTAANGGGEESSSTQKMHYESRRRQFGSDMEILVRALCAEKGWDALISRRRRGCLACAIREAGALGWKVIIRVD